MTWSAAVTEVTFVGGNSSKFYRTYLLHNSDTNEVGVLFNFGRIGSNGQFKAVRCHTHQEASYAVDRKLSEKTRGGYTNERHRTLSVVPEDLLDRAEIRVDDTVRTQQTERLKVDDFSRFAAEADSLIRVLTGPTALTGDAIVMRTTLQESLDALRVRLQEAEGQMEIINEVVQMKVMA